MHNIIIVSGGFDPIHSGHIKLIEDASRYGNIIVLLNSDTWLENKKGKAFLPFEERKIIMVISDGAPVDDSTLSVNSGDFLEKHLKKIVKFIEDKTEIEILAIGIGHDVSRYYNRAIKITDVNELGDVMISQLSELFEKKNKLH